MSCSADAPLADSASTRKNLAAGHITVRVLEQSHCEIALADAGADARRKDSTAIYLRCYVPKRTVWKQLEWIFSARKDSRQRRHVMNFQLYQGERAFYAGSIL